MEDLLNIYVCIIAPLFLMFLILKNDSKRLNLFLIFGMTACLAAGFANTFLVSCSHYNAVQATYYVTPIIEETFKALPVLLYVILKKPQSESVITAALAVGIGFATLENCFYITLDGASSFMFLFIRGFATGIMHSLCTAMIGFGLIFVYQYKKLALSGTFGLLCGAITYHATYNLLVASSGPTKAIGILLPGATAIVLLLLIHRPLKKYHDRKNNDE